jgi:glycosyltransferase involved in cell wall biosynthesis
MLLSLGHDVFYYGAEGSDVPCTQFIQTHSLKDIRTDYGDGDNRFEIGYNWKQCDFRHDFNTERKPSTQRFHHAAIDAISKNRCDDDFLLCTQGSHQSPIANALKLFLTCEPGIGYRGSVKGRFRAFESSYIQNFTYGSEAPFQCVNGNYYDRVIPNYFDPDDIEFSAEKSDYYLFIGRMIKRKGIITADLACRALGAKLIIAGQGAHVTPRGSLLPNDTPDFELEPGTWEYVGYCDVEKRKKLMARAIATFTPTEYLECFAGTHIESMLSGTPVITTDFGVFPGTVINGLNGYRCSTLQAFVDAARRVKNMDHVAVYNSAAGYLMESVAQEFNKWFHDLHTVWESAVDLSKQGWHRLAL